MKKLKMTNDLTNEGSIFYSLKFNFKISIFVICTLYNKI